MLKLWYHFIFKSLPYLIIFIINNNVLSLHRWIIVWIQSVHSINRSNLPMTEILLKKRTQFTIHHLPTAATHIFSSYHHWRNDPPAHILGELPTHSHQQKRLRTEFYSQQLPLKRQNTTYDRIVT